MANDIIDTINKLLLESENFSNEFLPLQDTLNPIKEDLNSTLQELREKAKNSTNTADKVFYLNRYTDLIKKVESIFEARGKRLQQTLQTLSKLSPSVTTNEVKNATDNVNNDNDLTPEQCNEILKILRS